MERFLQGCLLGAMGLLAAVGPQAAQAESVDFDRQIRPLLADRCFHCHGPDESTRKAGLRLDDRAAATAEGKHGRAIVPGKPALSLVVQRLRSSDPDHRMPPEDSGRTMNKEEIALIEKWMQQGAGWSRHWAFVAPERPELPALPGDAPDSWKTHPIDRFVLQRLKSAGLAPSAPADSYRLLRRLSLDLTGLPPSWEEARAFAQQPSEEAYLKHVDRLLASPHFGERLAMFWLGAARYSDTDGYQQDATRQNWPWRDWVVEAFNANMPFDRFTLDQFAGDLLENAGESQKLATGFHRHHMTNGEGGRDPEESRVDYVIDRINTVGTVWLGLTLGCCQCHSHKYDPITQAEYYGLSAFFNSIDEDGRAGDKAGPYLSMRSAYSTDSLKEAQKWLEEQQKLEKQAARNAEGRFQEWLSGILRNLDAGFQAWRPLKAITLESRGGSVLHQQEEAVIEAGGPDPLHEDYLIHAVPAGRLTGLKLEVLPATAHEGTGWSRSESGDFVLTDLKLRVRRAEESEAREIRVVSAKADHAADTKKHAGYGRIEHVLDDDPRNGWASYEAGRSAPLHAVFALAEPLQLEQDETLVIELQQRSLRGHGNLARFRLWTTDQPGETPRSLGRAPLEDLAASGSREPRQVEAKLLDRLRRQFLEEDADYQIVRRAMDRARDQVEDCKKAAGDLKVMVLAERDTLRPTHVLVRGEWDKKGDRVERGSPREILPWPADLPADRVGLARWITHPENPLAARVAVNHFWGLVFGRGLVRTPEDFGVQGEQPTHPELLDWLAVEFRESGWDVKKLIRGMVTSAAYRQSSDVSPRLLEQDPDNRLLARGDRFRLPSWMIRDAAIQSAGLLNGRLGGPPVYPHQPPGVWADITMGRFHYEPSVGPAQYRRSLYAFWRRSSSPAFLFDAEDRRVCAVQPARTNTPLQALLLMNSPERLAASAALARKVLNDSALAEQVPENLFRLVLTREPGSRESEELRRMHREALIFYREHRQEAEKLPSGALAPDGLVRAEQAAATVVANLLFNLDEAISRE